MYRYQRYFFPTSSLVGRSRSLSLTLSDGLLGFSSVLYIYIYIFFFVFSLFKQLKTRLPPSNEYSPHTRYARPRFFLSFYFYHVKLCFFLFAFFAVGCMDWGFDFGFSFLFNFRKIHPWFCNVLRIGLVRFTSHLFLAIFCVHFIQMKWIQACSYLFWIYEKRQNLEPRECERGVDGRERVYEWGMNERAHAQETKVPRKVTIEWITK